MNKTHVIVSASKNWSDEFDCEFFGVYSKAEWSRLKRDVKKAWQSPGAIEIYFGTNESLNFSDYADWIRIFSVKDITEDEAKFLIKKFGKTFGTGAVALTEIVPILEELANEDQEQD